MFSEDVISSLKRSLDSGFVSHGPVSVQVLPSGICNAQCLFCPIHSGVIPIEIKKKHAPRLISKGGLLDMRRYQEFIDDLKEIGLTRRIQYTGLGESLVHSGVAEMVAYAREKLPDCSLILITNGINLGRYCQDLISAGVDEISVSLNAGRPETWVKLNRIGKEDQFDSIVEALEYLGSIKKGEKPKLTITSVLNRYNYDETRELFEIAQKAKSEALSFIRTTVFDFGGFHTNKQLLCSPDQFRQFEKTLDELKNKNGKAHLSLCGNGPDDGSLDTRFFSATVPCHAGWTFTVLFPDGSIYPCCQCETKMGNIANERFKDIWQSKRYSAFRTRAMRMPQLGRIRGCLCDECGYFHENQEYHRLLAL